ncbi:MAG: efflux RND transporter periplasmic adaptor subunit [Bacteroidota bacterium]
MKHTYLSIIMAALLIACGGQDEVAVEDMSVEEKKTLLREKQETAKALQSEIEELQGALEAKGAAPQERLTLVTTQPVERTTFTSYTEVQGSVEAEDLVSVASETGGRVIDMKMQEGKYVRKGQLVAKVDLEQVEKQIAELETQLELANDLFERQKRLWDQEIGSEVQYLQAKNNKERLEKSLETIRLQLGKSNIYAPISGVVEMLIVKAGEIAAPGAPIAQILNTAKVKIAADVPETLIQSVSKGEKVIAAVPALDWEKEVRITELGRTIDKTNRTLRVEADIPGGNSQLKPNLLATIRIQDKVIEDAVVIPLTQLQQEVGGKSFVMVKAENADGQPIAKKAYVEVGESYEGQIIITQGLSGNEQLLMKGARNLKDGARIDIVEEEIAGK